MKQHTNTDSQPNLGKARRHFLKSAGVIASGLVGPFTSLSIRAQTEKQSNLEAFKASIKGTVVSKASRNYEPWRSSMAWNNRRFDRFPDVIVQAENDEDVIATVNFARDNNLKIKSRSGGHSWSGCYMRDGGILLDLSRFQSMDVDEKNKTVVIGAGVIGRALNVRLAEYDLVYPTAHCGMVPVTGFALGGGLGLNSHTWGKRSAYTILEMDVVTPDGEFKKVSATENPELFWVARGAGPGLFFTVLRLKLQCYPLCHFIRADYYFLPYDELIPAVTMLEEIAPKMGTTVELITMVVPNPAKGDVTVHRDRGDFDHVTVCAAIAFGYSEEESAKALAPLREHPLMKKATNSVVNRHSSLEDLYMDNEVPFPQTRARVDNIFTDKVVEATAFIAKHAPESPSAGNTPFVFYMGDFERREDACYSASGKFYVAGYTQWREAKDDYVNSQWLKNIFDQMQPLATGYYINEYDRETRSKEIHRCYRPEDWQRIEELRGKYDPNGVYHGFLEV